MKYNEAGIYILTSNWILKIKVALAGMAQLVGALFHTPKDWGSASHQGTHLSCRFNSQMLTGDCRSMFLSHIDASLSLPSFLSKINQPIKIHA